MKNTKQKRLAHQCAAKVANDMHDTERDWLESQIGKKYIAIAKAYFSKYGNNGFEIAIRYYARRITE